MTKNPVIKDLERKAIIKIFTEASDDLDEIEIRAESLRAKLDFVLEWLKKS